MVVSYVISFAVIIPIYYLIPELFGTKNHSLIITHLAIFVAIILVYGILKRISMKKYLMNEQV